MPIGSLLPHLRLDLLIDTPMLLLEPSSDPDPGIDQLIYNAPSADECCEDAITAPEVFTKQPLERLRVRVNFADRLGTAVMTGIHSISCNVAGIVEVNEQHANIPGEFVRFWVSGGTTPARARIQANVTTQNGAIVSCDCRLNIRD